MNVKNIKGTTLSVLLLLTMAVTVSAQDKPAPAAKPDAAPQAQQVSTGKEYLGPTADSIRPYRSSGRDPFKKTIKPKTPRGKQVQARMLGFPTLDVRRAEFRQKVEQARARDGAEPDPVSQYLVSELDVTGVFRDDRGYGAFVRAQPTGTMFFVRNGAHCFNGEVMRIGGDNSDPGSAKVVFREVSYQELNGKQTPQERVVTKAPGEKK
ncbi:MAG: hypothetical protein DMF60_01665 [Acidobacteria bacterium]|nr:MAG: hypothetical protein DMF60_01665 [Acidobacteriota bacterium]